MKPAAGTAGELQKAQVTRHPLQHAVIGFPPPQANAEAQGPRVVVGRIAALAARDAVDGMLDQAGGIRHAVQVIQDWLVVKMHY
jgi:hypothetical protein